MDTELNPGDRVMYGSSQGDFKVGDAVFDGTRGTIGGKGTVDTVIEEPFSVGDKVYHRDHDVCTVVVGSKDVHEGKVRIMDKTEKQRWVYPHKIELTEPGPNRNTISVCFRDKENKIWCVPPGDLVHVRTNNRKAQVPERLTYGHTPSATQTWGS